MSSLLLLPASTVHRIASSQVITSVSTAIKELVENALDAGADNVEVKLEEHGLSKIEVRDNGCGIKREDAQVMAQRYYTSKISCFENLSELTTYGFRGEALCSLCAMGNVVITTKTRENAVAVCYTLGQSGKVFSTKPVPSTTGTAVVVTNLFKNLPVRKQFLSSKKKCKEELKKIEELVMAFGCIHPEVRLVLWHNKSIIWQKGKVTDYKTSLVTILGSSVMMQMDKVEYKDQEYGFEFAGYLPKLDADPSVSCRANNDRCFIFVNDRPVLIKEVSQLVKELYSPAGNRHPIIFLSIKLPPDGVDVNLEPNKTRVLLVEKERILDAIRAMLEKFYKNENANPKDFPNSSSENGETCKIVEKSFDKNSNTVSIIEERISDIGESCSTTSNNSTTTGTSSSKTEQLKDNISMEDTFNTVASSTQNNFGSIEKTIGLDNFPSDKVFSKNQPETTDHLSTCLMTEKSLINFEQTRNNMELTLLNHKESAATLSSIVSLGDTACTPKVRYGNVDAVGGTTDAINEDSCVVMATSSTEESKFDNPKSISEFCANTTTNTCNTNCITNDSQTSLELGPRGSNLNAINSKETIDLNESSKNSNPDLNTQDVNNIYKLLDLSEKENNQISHLEEDSVEFPVPPSQSIPNDKDTSKEDLSNSSFELDNVFDNLEFDEILKDIAKKKAVDSQSTQASESDSQTAASKVKDMIDLTSDNLSNKNWSMGNVLKDKQDNVIEPTKLLTASGVKPVDQNKPSAVPGKRKHSGEKSLSLKRNKKIKQTCNQVNNQSLITVHAEQSPQQRYQEAKKVTVPFSMSNLKSYTSHPRRSMSSSKHHLIGRLEPSGVWLMLKGDDVTFLNQYRIQEQILFYKLMQTHSLTGERLEKSIRLEPRLVGGEECWNILTDLECQNQPLDSTRFIMDERIKSNGFDIRIKQDPDTEDVKIEVIAIATSIPFYGIPDLVEVLGLIKDSGTREGSLSECRPLKVINYLKGEAVRVCRGTVTRMCREDVSTMLTQMDEYLPYHVTSCIHHKPFTGHVASLSLS